MRWRLWRITSDARPRGPLWLVPHDNEDGAFDAALVAVRRYGGTVVAVDSGVRPAHDGQRFNYAVDRTAAPVDPNRNFESPVYAAAVLGAWRPADGPIVALHTNQPGFDPRLSSCNTGDPPGNGVISIRYCDARYAPRPSSSRAWPFDDDDTLAYLPFLAGRDPATAFCAALTGTDFNLVAETVGVGDGSISNHAVPRGFPYLTLETRDSGRDAAAHADQRDRLTAMIDRIFALCVPEIMREAG